MPFMAVPGNIEINNGDDDGASQISAKGSGIVAVMSDDGNAEGRIIITHVDNSITAGTNGIFAWAQRRSGYSEHEEIVTGTKSTVVANSFADDGSRDDPMILITSSGDITSGSTTVSPTFRFKVDNDDYRGAAWEAADKALGTGNAAIKALAIDHYEIAEYIAFADSFSEDFDFDGAIPDDATLSALESALITAVLGGGDVEEALGNLDQDDYDDDFRNKIREYAAGYNAGNIKIEVTDGTVRSTDGDGVVARFGRFNDKNGAIEVTVAEGAAIEGNGEDRYGIDVWFAGLDDKETAGDGSDDVRKQSVTVDGTVTGDRGCRPAERRRHRDRGGNRCNHRRKVWRDYYR